MDSYYHIQLNAQTHMAARRKEAQQRRLAKEAQQTNDHSANSILTGLGRLLVQTGQHLQELDTSRPSDVRLEPRPSHR